MLRIFESSAYFSGKDDKINPQVKKFVFLCVKRNMKIYKFWDPKNKKIVLNKHVTFDATLLLKSIISQQVERVKTNDVSQWMEVDATLPSPVGSVSLKISLDVTPGGDHTISFDAEHVENINENVELFAAIRTKINP